MSSLINELETGAISVGIIAVIAVLGLGGYLFYEYVWPLIRDFFNWGKHTEKELTEDTVSTFNAVTGWTADNIAAPVADFIHELLPFTAGPGKDLPDGVISNYLAELTGGHVQAGTLDNFGHVIPSNLHNKDQNGYRVYELYNKKEGNRLLEKRWEYDEKTGKWGFDDKYIYDKNGNLLTIISATHVDKAEFDNYILDTKGQTFYKQNQ